MGEPRVLHVLRRPYMIMLRPAVSINGYQHPEADVGDPVIDVGDHRVQHSREYAAVGNRRPTETTPNRPPRPSRRCPVMQCNTVNFHGAINKSHLNGKVSNYVHVKEDCPA